MNYDDWKTTEPVTEPAPNEHQPYSDACQCTECADESGDDDYSWEREPLCVLVDDEVES